jgi:cyclic pyranopterin phosphate synthase
MRQRGALSVSELNSPLLEKLQQQSVETQSLFAQKNLATQSFCVMPFVNIILEPNGEVGVCRHKGTEFTFGNLKDKTIDEIWTSPAIQEWRREHLTGDLKVCKTEVGDRRCNLCPELNKLLPHAEIDNIENPKILRLTANLNGKCNLECPMCDVWKLPNGHYTEENFWIPAREKFFKDILEIDMLSGEPFIQKDTYRLMDEVSSVNPDCQWTITTNLHWKLTPAIEKHLDKIKMKVLIISIDSLIPETYASIRKLGKLEFVLENLMAIRRYEQTRIERGLTPINLRLNATIQKENWREVKSIIKFCYEQNIIPFVSFLYAPEELSLLTLSEEERLEIVEFYFKDLNKAECLHSLRVLKPLIRSLSKIDYSFYMLELQKKIS